MALVLLVKFCDFYWSVIYTPGFPSGRSILWPRWHMSECFTCYWLL